MELFRVYAFPAMLVLGAMWLAAVEWRHFRTDGSPSLMRLLRRLAGAAVLVAVAVMVHLGDTSAGPRLTLQEATDRFHYWMAVLGLVAFAMVLAVWDVIDGLRRLGSYLEDVERDEMQSLRQRLKERNS